ncbi:MAG: hypothetical protein KC613_04760 [Myxococcales bacterium]|nr:hypothetical protein [Myxococcales bacterium]MCB9526764.1 hypothetical protein [Myxococcales bacterium]
MLRPDDQLGDEEGVFDGVFVGVVTNNHDPENLGRIKVVFPWDDNETESHWARLATLYAGKDRGNYFVPEVGDEVLVVFELGHIDSPFIVGSLWNGVDELPEPGHPDGQNNHKVFETRSGHKMTFDETSGAEKITLVDSSLNNRIVIDVAQDDIMILAATGDIHIKAPAGKVDFFSKTMSINVQTTKDHTTGADHSITVKAGSYAETVGSTKTVTAGNASRTAKHTDIKASGQFSTTGGSAKVKLSEAGSMIQKGNITQQVGNAMQQAEQEFVSAPSKTWNAGSLSFNADGMGTLDTGPLEISAGELTTDAEMGQLSLMSSQISQLGGIMKFTADQLSFKPLGPPAGEQPPPQPKR